MYVRKFLKRWWGIGLLVALTFVLALLIIGCRGAPSATGSPSPTVGQTTKAPTTTANAVSGTLTGKITNSLNGAPVAKAKLVTDPAIPDQNIVTDANGAFSTNLPIGTYKLNITRDGFTAATDSVNLVAGQTVTKNIVLKPVKPVAVSTGQAQSADPGATVTLKATAEPLDNSTIKSYEWKQVSGVPATLGDTKTDTLSVTLNKAPAYKEQILKGLELLDRVDVLGVNPHALIAAETTTFQVTVTTSSGSYTSNVNVTAKLPFEFTLGIENVPQGVPVLLNGKNQSTYDWSVAGPAGSKATLDAPTSRNPVIIPDVVGKYTLTEKVSGATLNVYAGTWTGMITGQDAKGLPLSEGCTTCHNGKIAADQFTAWRQSGHAEIFTQNINDPAGHWAINCAECHTVGYDPAVKNGGFDEAVTEEGWKVPPHGDVGLWTQILSKYPKTAKLANIQCENCHGPNNGSGLHANGVVDTARISISSDVCGACHGEPPRHGRFQQWEESGHGNYEPAIIEATVENRGATAAHCGRCHSGQGFLAWTQQGDLTKQIQGKSGNATVEELTKLGLTKDSVHPVTCVVCHEPHNPGETSGEPNTATVRIVGKTGKLPSGFAAENVGKGALCMTCHNTRNGLHNDTAAPTNFSAPHVAAQTDVLLGQNAYFVETGRRSSHSLISDTCVTCHLNETPPPKDYSFNFAGTNHAFKADLSSCAACHSDKLDGKGLELSFEESLHELGNAMSAYMLNKLPAQFTVMDYTPHEYNGKSYDVKSDPVVIQKTNIASIEPVEPHGQQGFIVKFKAPVSVTYKPKDAEHTMQLSEIQVQLGDFTTDGKTAVIPNTDVLVKAGWNYFLLHGDGSEGIHNPDFSFEVVYASIKALK